MGTNRFTPSPWLANPNSVGGSGRQRHLADQSLALDDEDIEGKYVPVSCLRAVDVLFVLLGCLRQAELEASSSACVLSRLLDCLWEAELEASSLCSLDGGSNSVTARYKRHQGLQSPEKDITFGCEREELKKLKSRYRYTLK